MPDLDRTNITFEQAEGVEPLPIQLKPREVTKPLRAALWEALYLQLRASTRTTDPVYGTRAMTTPWLDILYDKHVHRDHNPADEFSSKPGPHVDELKSIVMSGSYLRVFGTLQWILRHVRCPPNFKARVATVLKECHAGYRLSDDEKTLIPIASEEEAATVLATFKALAPDTYAGGRQHLTNAAERLTAGDSPGAVRESMQAVESVARVITGKGTFSEALKVIEARWKIHGALKIGMARFYDYTSAEKGIRHPVLDDPTAQVDEADAMFMFGACAAFITYLINKAAAHPAAKTG
jgi:hypothetical protein